MIDVDLTVFEFKSKPISQDKELEIVLDYERKRFGSTINARTCENIEEFRSKLDELNRKAFEKCQDDLNNAINNVINGAKYERYIYYF